MKITVFTEKQLDEFRKRRSETITMLNSAHNELTAVSGRFERLSADIVSRICKFEGIVDMYDVAIQYGKFEGCIEALTAGADDTWSGRTNDLNRSRYDGKLHAFRRIYDMLKYSTH